MNSLLIDQPSGSGKKKKTNQQQPKYKQNTKGKRLLRGKEMGKKIKAQNITCAIISNNF